MLIMETFLAICGHFKTLATKVNFLVFQRFQRHGRSKVVAAFGRKPLNFRIPSGLAATLEQPCFSAKKPKSLLAKLLPQV
jgi:hypothetical protein